MENRRKNVAANKWYCYSADNSNTCMLAACKDGYCKKCEPICKDKLPTKTEFTKYETYNSGEEFVREVLLLMTGKYFNKEKPRFLDGLELDGYFADMKLAFEFQGIQHYEKHPRWHKDQVEFEKQLEYDTIKLKKCAELGINIIVVDGRRFHRYEMETWLFVYDKLIEFGHESVISRDQITKESAIKVKESVHEHWKNADQYYAKLAENARLQGYALLSERYLGHEANYKLICDEDHEFIYSYHAIFHSKQLDCYKCLQKTIPLPKPKVEKNDKPPPKHKKKKCNYIENDVVCTKNSVSLGKCDKHNPQKWCHYEGYVCDKLKVNKTDYCALHNNNVQNAINRDYKILTAQNLIARKKKTDPTM